MRVRYAAEPDLPEMVAILAHEVRRGEAHFGTTPPTVETLRAGLGGPYPKLVAEDGDRIVGIAGADRWKSREAYDWTAEINAYVRSDRQGQGIGRALYDELLARLRDLGVRTVFAGISLPNAASVRLHESVGMTKVAHLPNAGFKHGAWRDVGYWALDLRPELGDNGSPGSAPGLG